MGNVSRLLDVICKILCDQNVVRIFGKIAFQSQKHVNITRTYLLIKENLILWRDEKTIYQQFSIAPRKEDETKPLRITQANVCKNIQSTALTNNPQMHFLVKYFPSYHREMPGLKGSSKT